MKLSPQKLIAKFTLLIFLVQANTIHASLTQNLKVNVNLDPGLAGEMADPVIESGKDFTVLGNDKEGFTMSYVPLATPPETRKAVVNYPLKDNSSAYCQIVSRVQTNLAHPEKATATVSATSYSTENIACSFTEQPGSIKHNFFSLGTALTFSAGSAGILGLAGIITYGVAKIIEEKVNRQNYADLMRAANYSYKTINNSASLPEIQVGQNFEAMANEDIDEMNILHKKINIFLGEMPEFMNKDYFYKNFRKKNKEHIYLNYLAYDLLVYYFYTNKKYNQDLKECILYTINQIAKQNKIITKDLTQIIKTENKLKQFYTYQGVYRIDYFYKEMEDYIKYTKKSNHKKKSKINSFVSEAKLIKDIFIEHKTKYPAENPRQQLLIQRLQDTKVSPHFSRAQTAGKILGVFAFAGLLTPMIAYVINEIANGYTFDLKINRVSGFNLVSSAVDTFSSSNGGVFYSPEEGISVLMVPTGEHLISLASNNPEETPENPNLYRIESILPGIATMASESCAVIPTEEDSHPANFRSIIVTGAEKGLSIASFDGNATLVAHRVLFPNMHVKQVILEQNADTKHCGAFVHLQEWVKTPDSDPNANEGFWQDKFLFTENDAPSLSPETTGESHFFAIKHGATDELGNTYFVKEKDGKDAVFTLHGKTKKLFSETGINLPENIKIAHMTTLANGRVLAVDSAGQGYYSTPDGTFTPVTTNTIDLAIFNRSQNVSLSKENDKQAISIFYPQETLTNPQNPAYLGAYLVWLPPAEQEHTLNDARIEKVFPEALVVLFQDIPSLLTLAKPENITAEGEVLVRENYLVAPKALREHFNLAADSTTSAEEIIKQHKVMNAANSPDTLSKDTFYAEENGKFLRYNTSEETLVSIKTQLKPEPFVLMPLWLAKSVVATQGNRLHIKDTLGALAQSFEFPTPILTIGTTLARAEEQNVEVILVSTEAGGLWILVPVLDEMGQPVKNSYTIAKHLFDGFHFDFAEGQGELLVVSDQDFGTFASRQFDLLQQNIHDLGEEHFDFIEETEETEG